MNRLLSNTMLVGILMVSASCAAQNVVPQLPKAHIQEETKKSLGIQALNIVQKKERMFKSIHIPQEDGTTR